MRIMKLVMAAFAVLAFTAMAASSASAHPLFLTLSGNELLFSGTNPSSSTPTLRALDVGVLGTITCKTVKVDGFALPKSPLAHRIVTEFSGDCLQVVGATKSTCTEPIVVKRALAELGLITGKIAAIYLAPSDGTTVFAAPVCGGNTTTVEGTIVGTIPLENASRENQYNNLRSETEQVFESVGKNSENEANTTIELLGTTMNGVELKVSGFFGGKASEEVVVNLKGDGKMEICTKADSACP